MNCDTVRAHIKDYVASEISEKLRKALDRHFEICRECKNSLQSLHWVWDQLGNCAISCPSADDLMTTTRLEIHHLFEELLVNVRTLLLRS